MAFKRPSCEISCKICVIFFFRCLSFIASGFRRLRGRSPPTEGQPHGLMAQSSHQECHRLDGQPPGLLDGPLNGNHSVWPAPLWTNSQPLGGVASMGPVASQGTQQQWPARWTEGPCFGKTSQPCGLIGQALWPAGQPKGSRPATWANWLLLYVVWPMQLAPFSICEQGLRTQKDIGHPP